MLALPTLDHLLGATLDQIALDWRNGTARITFLSSPRMKESYALRATAFTRIDVPRSAQASRTVLAARLVAGGAHPVAEIAMESGETLSLEALSFVLEPIGG